MTATHKEKERDNFHTVLIAKNYDGVLELNQLVSESYNEEHFYYKPRISFDEFLKISNNVIKISACLASPLSRLSPQDKYYEKLARHYDYYEIQPHNCIDQIRYNQHLCQLATMYNKPLIAGTDTHNLNDYKAECRKLLIQAKFSSKGKPFEYANEDDFNLTYRSYYELYSEFKTQDAIPAKLWESAIANTIVMADSVEDFTIDTAYKYPILYGSHEKDAEVYRERLESKFAEKIDKGIIPQSQVESFRNALDEETRVFEKIDMIGFMLSMSEFVCWAKGHDIPVGFGRGSVGGSRVAYVLDITDVNPETWHTVFSRFANEDRREIGD